jgi:hypothetical protein
MQIGEYVRHFIDQIFKNDEIEQLQDKEYSKKNFGINYPFCMDIERIKGEKLDGRYWAKVYEVCSKKVRVANDWHPRNLAPFKEYLKSKSIELDIEDPSIIDKGLKSSRSEAQLKANPIGNAQHTEYSTYREKLIEHLFVGELLKLSWNQHKCELEIAKPEVDNSGYDIIAESNRVIRHIQIKTSRIGAKTAKQKVHIRLAEKSSGCIIWIYFDESNMDIRHFYFFGSEAGSPMPDINDFKTAKHSKGNKDGLKAERQNMREVPKGKFKKIDTIEGIYEQLFVKTNHQKG